MKRALLTVLSVACAIYASAETPLELVQTISLPGVEGRIDHLAIDVELQRLYVAALGNGTIEVIDLVAGKRLGAISGLNEPQGIAVIPKTHTIVVGSGGDGAGLFYNSDFKLIGAVKGLEDADNVRYDATADRIYIGYGNGFLAVLDPAGPRPVSTWKLAGHPESFQLASADSRVYVNIPTAQQIAVVDRGQGVVARWRVFQAHSNFPMALDEEHQRLFVACREPANLLVFNTETGAVTVINDCVGDADDVFYDVRRSRIYVVGGEGLVSVFSQSDADHYAFMGSATTAPGARTAFLSPDTDRLYVAVPHRGTQAAEIRVFQAQ